MNEDIFNLISMYLKIIQNIPIPIENAMERPKQDDGYVNFVYGDPQDVAFCYDTNSHELELKSLDFGIGEEKDK